MHLAVGDGRREAERVAFVEVGEQAFEDGSGLGWNQLIPASTRPPVAPGDPLKGDARPHAHTRFGVLTDRPFPVLADDADGDAGGNRPRGNFLGTIPVPGRLSIGHEQHGAPALRLRPAP